MGSASPGVASVNSDQPLLRLSGIAKTYPSGRDVVRVLDGVDLEIRRGEFVAIKGPSGAGKTTMLQLAAGLDTPTSGNVVFDGCCLGDMDERELVKVRRSQFGFVFQFFNLIPGLNVRDNIALPMLLDGRPRDVAAQIAAEAIAAVDLTSRAGQMVSELSGGEMQRTAVARAIAHTPSIVFADEPTGSLDTQNGDAVLELLETACKERGTAVLMVTHEQRVAERADRTVAIRDGKVLTDEAVLSPATELDG